jgi:hypothetical protein
VLLLLQAENVLALVNARTAAAADSALAGLQGGLGQLVSELRRDVLSIITELEARLDFDEDLPPLDVEQLKQDIAGKSGFDRLQSSIVYSTVQHRYMGQSPNFSTCQRAKAHDGAWHGLGLICADAWYCHNWEVVLVGIKSMHAVVFGACACIGVIALGNSSAPAELPHSKCINKRVCVLHVRLQICKKTLRMRSGPAGRAIYCVRVCR